MEKEQPSRKWTSDETSLFCEILPDPINSFMETLEKRALKNYQHMKYLISLLLDLKKAWKVLSSKKKFKNFESKKRET